jgi:hypothetical protein
MFFPKGTSSKDGSKVTHNITQLANIMVCLGILIVVTYEIRVFFKGAEK